MWGRQEQRDFFWAGFLAGTVLGGVVGALFASEAGVRAYRYLESRAEDFQGRVNGRAGSVEGESAQQENVENPT